MSFVAAAIGGAVGWGVGGTLTAAAIGAGVGGMIGGGVNSANAAQSAANTQAAAQQQAAQTQLQMFNTINQQEQPFIQAGYGATTGLNQLMGLAPGTSNTGGLPNSYLTQPFDVNTFLNSPQYQFQQQQGSQAVRNADTPTMGALSGAAMKDLMSFNQGLASTYYQNYFNMQQQQQQNIFNRLSGLATIGQNAASNTGAAGTQLGTGIAQAQAGAGASQAAGTIGAANAYTGAFNNASGLGLGLYYLMNK